MPQLQKYCFYNEIVICNEMIVFLKCWLCIRILAMKALNISCQSWCIDKYKHLNIGTYSMPILPILIKISPIQTTLFKNWFVIKKITGEMKMYIFEVNIKNVDKVNEIFKLNLHNYALKTFMAFNNRRVISFIRKLGFFYWNTR